MNAAGPELLVVAATDREAACFRDAGLSTVVSGVGRVNAAIATTLALAGRGRDGSSPLVVSVGIAGALPDVDGGPGVPIGSTIVGTAAACVEEGIATPTGFQSIAAMGFPLAAFVEDDAIPADPDGLARVSACLPDAVQRPIATVATCSGTDDAAVEVVRRSRAVAEAMEGAGVLHAARLLGAAAVEVRVVSNTTGDRERQVWRLDEAFEALAGVARALAG